VLLLLLLLVLVLVLVLLLLLLLLLVLVHLLVIFARGSPLGSQRAAEPGSGKGANVRAHGCASLRRPENGEQRRAPRELHPRGASLGCPSLWLLLLGQARESNSLPAGQ